MNNPVKVAVFSTKPYDQFFLGSANQSHGHELVFLEPRLTPETAPLAEGFPAVCVFVNDRVDRTVQEQLASGGTRLIATRSAGYNHIDLLAANELALSVVRVPAYSPHAVAEHTAGLILTLNRKIHRAYNRVRDGNFALDGLLGFDLHGRTVGIVGTGHIGAVLARIMKGFGCEILAYDPYPNPEVEALGVRYLALDELVAQSDILTLHCPLTPETYHLIDEHLLEHAKPGMMLINTSRGALLDTPAVIEALKSGTIGYLGMDVYEEEEGLFFEDLSNQVIRDDVFARLLTFPNVVITGHQAFFTQEALERIAHTTLENITAFASRKPLENQVTVRQVVSDTKGS
jgi:D-lactate dehydrogenase